MFVILPSLQLSDKQPPPKTSLANYYHCKKKTKSHQMLIDPMGWIAANLLLWRKHVLFIGNNIIGIKEIINVGEMPIMQ